MKSIKKSKAFKKISALAVCAVMAVSCYGISVSAASVTTNCGVGISSNNAIAEMATSQTATIKISSTFTYYNAKGTKVSSSFNDTAYNAIYLNRGFYSNKGVKKVNANFYRNGTKITTLTKSY